MAKKIFITELDSKPIAAHQATYAEKDAYGDDIHSTLATKVDKVEGKGLSTEDYTTAEQTKLSGIASGAQVNKIESISANGTALSPDANKNVDIPLATSEVDGLLPKEKFPLIPAAPVAGADRIYSFDDTNLTSWQTIVKEYVGNMILDQQGNPVTDEEGEIMYEEEAVPLWLSYKGVEFGARRAYDDHTGANIHDSIEARTTMAQVTTAIETALANYGGFVVVNSLVDGHPDVQNPSERFIYLYKDSSGPVQDPYTEWIYTADHTWDVIGTTYIDITNFTHKVANATGNIPKLDSNGDLVDSGVAAASLTSKAAVDGGTDLSLVTTGEKYVWNNTRQLPDPEGHVNGAVLSIMSNSGTRNVQWDGESEDDFITFNFPEGVTVPKDTGHTYKAIQINNLIWMAEDLDYVIPGLGNTIQSGGTERYTAGYNNLLYSWNALTYFINSVQLETGWRVPTRSDFESLLTYVNNSAQYSNLSLMTIGEWGSLNATNDTGFSALPGGVYHRYVKYGMSWEGCDCYKTDAFYWTADVYNGNNNYYVQLNSNTGTTVTAHAGGLFGASIRLVKDAPVEE